MGKRLRRRNDVTLHNNDPSPMNNVNVDQERLRVALWQKVTIGPGTPYRFGWNPGSALCLMSADTEVNKGTSRFHRRKAHFTVQMLSLRNN